MPGTRQLQFDIEETSDFAAYFRPVADYRRNNDFLFFADNRRKQAHIYRVRDYWRHHCDKPSSLSGYLEAAEKLNLVYDFCFDSSAYGPDF